MNLKLFIKYLIITTIVSIAVVFALGVVLPTNSFLDLSIFALAFFISLSFVVFKLGEKAVKSSNKYSYINLIISNMMVKMFFSFIIVLVYAKLTSPENKYFVVPFMFIYLIFTAFETYFMTIQGKAKITNDKNG